MDSGLRPLEWFGLVSGIIGLAADILSLMTLATPMGLKGGIGINFNLDYSCLGARSCRSTLLGGYSRVLCEKIRPFATSAEK